jgi:hypothetical protein
MDFMWDRPLSTGEILISALGLTRQHGRLLMRLAIGPLLVIAAIDLASRVMPAESLAILPVLLICFALYGIAETRATVAVWELLHHRTVDPGTVIAQVRRRSRTVVPTYVLKSILVLIGLVFFVVPGLLLTARWFAVPLTNVVEELGVRAGLRRSRTLARGNRRQIIATLGIIDVTVTLMMVGFALAVADDTSGEEPAWATILSWLVALLYLPFHAALSAVLYANARLRNEGYTV